HRPDCRQLRRPAQADRLRDRRSGRARGQRARREGRGESHPSGRRRRDLDGAMLTPSSEVLMSNPLVELAKTGQSVWFDQMERRLVTSGELQRMIDEDDLRGLTSNPTIFEKAISGSEDYDAQLRDLASQNKSREEIYDAV